MGTKLESESETDPPDTGTRIDAIPPAANRSNDTTEMVAAAPVVYATHYHGQAHFFDIKIDGTGDALDGFVADVTTLMHFQCERATDYADIETLVCCLPIDHFTFAVHDSSAPYSGPYPMALLVRAFLIKEINNWDETALHDYLRANPTLHRRLGFDSLPAQSTFW